VLVQCSSDVVTLLLHCCYTVVTLLLQSCYCLSAGSVRDVITIDIYISLQLCKMNDARETQINAKQGTIKAVNTSKLGDCTSTSHKALYAYVAMPTV
jgi:hypothetical protein